MEPAEVAILRRALDPLGITLGVRVVDDGDDELILIVPPTEFPKLNEGRLTQDLTTALGRKIWIVTDSPRWQARSVPLPASGEEGGT